MLRTIEEVLGLARLSGDDSGVLPMTDAFDTTQTTWAHSATPAAILYTASLPLPGKGVVNRVAIPKPTHDAACWEVQTKGFDFSQEDRVDPEQFNRIVWQGMMEDKPYPITHSGANLRENRQKLLKFSTPAARDQINQPPGSIAMSAHPESMPKRRVRRTRLFSRCWLLSSHTGTLPQSVHENFQQDLGSLSVSYACN